MKPVVTAAEMRALDAATITEIGLPGAVLMETAGRAIAAAVARAAPRGSIAILCGPGNNGGDGFVVARVLRGQGRDATVLLTGTIAAVRGDARLHLDALVRSGGVVHEIAALGDDHAAVIAEAAVIVDALFGTGLARPLGGAAAAMVVHANRARGVRIAADLPSGLDADTGRASDPCFAADVTVTLGALKVGIASAPGHARAGAVEVADIGIPPALVAATAIKAGLVEVEDVRACVPRMAALDHKGRRGHALIVGGGPGKRGAARLASIAALRAGAGLVTWAAPTIASADELTAADVIMTEALGPDAARMSAVLAGKAAVCIGPGLGRGAGALALIEAVLAAGVPAVLDADALVAIADHPELVIGATGAVILTPHPGEAARLAGTTTAAIEADRLAAARVLAAKFRAVVVLKGARTVVCDGLLGDDFCAINPTGGPALATAGTGDVLAGTITALVAQGLAAVDAARAGVWIHGAAGEQVGGERGRGATAADVADALPAAILAL
ncbi:MAG: NAD(P)H-hydrate dehydratase [Deltaproteobacteria bacterium]|nr:NAD(P)H-hydrate dehydratase [Deltaproteobacteria bacterium]